MSTMLSLALLGMSMLIQMSSSAAAPQSQLLTNGSDYNVITLKHTASNRSLKFTQPTVTEPDNHPCASGTDQEVEEGDPWVQWKLYVIPKGSPRYAEIKASR
eukprot:41117_1